MRYNNPLVSIYFLSLLFIANTHVLLAQWQQCGLKDDYLIPILKSDSTLFVGGHSRIYISGDQANTWHEKHRGLEGTEAICGIIKVQKTIIATAHGIIKSDDMGETWKTIFSDSSIYDFNQIIGIDTTIFFAGGKNGNRIFRSLDGGYKWNEITPNNNQDFITGLVKYNDRVIFCVDRDPKIWFSKGGVYYSSDNGDSWTYFSQDKIGGNGRYPEMGVQNGTLFVSSDDGLLRSSNWGLSWNLCLQADGILAIFSYKNLLLAGCALGMIYASIDNGITWKRIDEGFYGNANFMSAFEADEDYIYMITRFNGIWRRKTKEVYSRLLDTGSSKQYNNLWLDSYPNPISSRANIKYELANREYVKISLCDVYGRVLKNIVEEINNPGSYTTSISADNIQSGVYFIQLSTGEKRITKKCIVLK